jgi:lipopolysaccharide transport system ATP-binding protein
MEDVGKEGRTVIFVSHNMAAVKSLCTKGILLSNGAMAYQGETATAVAKYMLGEAKNANVRTFHEAYNQNLFTLKEIRIQAVSKTLDEPLSEYDELHIETDLEIKQENDRLHFTYVLKNETGEPLFTFSHRQAQIALKSGINRLVCKLPKGFLNIGSYHLDAYLIKDTRETVFTEKDILSLNVQEGERGIGSWMGKEPGVIKPIFEWTNEII